VTVRTESGGLDADASACVAPSGITRLALRGRRLSVSFEDALMPDRCLLLDLELEDGGIPPHDEGSLGAERVEARFDRARSGRTLPGPGSSTLSLPTAGQRAAGEDRRRIFGGAGD
jgi:hypothetical protein